MRSLLRYWLLLLLPLAVGAKPSDGVRFSPTELTPVERAFFTDLDDGTLEQHTLYDAFLIASGLRDAVPFARSRLKFLIIRDLALREISTETAPYERGKALLFWLHDNVLKRYVTTATTAEDMLERGEYNCLSASILYTLLAGELGLDVAGVLVKEHAFCLLRDPRGDKDVETTVRYGFDPGQVEIERWRTTIRYIYVPKQEFAQREVVGLPSLLASLYANRLSLTTQPAADSPTELGLYKRSYYFDPRSTFIQTNLRASYNNLTIQALARHDFTAAQDYLAQWRLLEAGEVKLHALGGQYCLEFAQTAAARKDYRGALAIMKQGLVDYPQCDTIRPNIDAFYITWANEAFQRKEYPAAITILEEARAGSANPLIAHNLHAALYNLTIRHANAREYTDALAVLERALVHFPKDAELLKLKTTILGRRTRR
jgi:tetratricopeptide (TPR) repeat protein